MAKPTRIKAASWRPPEEPKTKIDPQDALVYLMVIMSAADSDMVEGEMVRMGAIIRTLPVFNGFDQARTLDVARNCQELLQEEGGFSSILDQIGDALSPELLETAYAIAVDIAAIDRKVRDEEIRILDILKQKFRLEPLAVAAIERAAAIRHRVL